MNNDEASYNLQWFDHAELTKNRENKYIIHQEISRKTEKLTPLSGWTPCQCWAWKILSKNRGMYL